MYKRRSPTLLPLLLLFVPALVSAQRAPDPDRAAVGEVITNLGEYFQIGDMSAAEALFRSGGMHILADDATTHGWAEYRDQHLAPELDIEGLHYAHTAVEPVVRGSVAWVAFRREISGTGTTPVEGRGTGVLEKVNARWVIVHLHMSR
jgi:hypothetical protein